MGEHLDILQIHTLTEWDVLSYILGHGASLGSAGRIARSLGYSEAAVGIALELLTSTGLLQRSRNSRGVRLYQMASVVKDDSRRRSLEQLINVAESRQGRLLIVSHLRHFAGRSSRRDHGGLHLA